MRSADARDLSWTKLGDHIGIAPSTIRRCEHALDMEADGCLATC